MVKKVLVIYYTQSGQLEEIIDNFTSPFHRENIFVEKLHLKPEKDFPFPWTGKSFFDAMPESVLGIPIQLNPFTLKYDKYDLIIFAYQPWYLSPSIPATSILNHEKITALLDGTPVVTLIGARNMWINAQEKIKNILADHNAQHVGNIALVDKHNNLVSAVTILYWMLTGKKDKMLGIFPKPGVAQKDIRDCNRFGETVLHYFINERWDNLQYDLVAQNAVEVNPNLMFIESRARKIFSVWANIIINKKNRENWLVVFKYYLIFALFIVAPIVLTINNILFRPFLGNQIRKKRNYYLGLN